MVPNISPEILIRRIPFLKSFQRGPETPDQIVMTRTVNNSNIFIDKGNYKIEFPKIVTHIKFIYEERSKQFSFRILVRMVVGEHPKIHGMISKELNPTELAIMSNFILNKMSNELSYEKHLDSPHHILPDVILDDVINKLNQKFFEIENFGEQNEWSNKIVGEALLKIKLRNILEAKASKPKKVAKKNPVKPQLNVPTPMSKGTTDTTNQELGVVPVGKLYGSLKQTQASSRELGLTRLKIANAKRINEAYKTAFKNKQSTFNVKYIDRLNSEMYMKEMQIPKHFFENPDNIHYLESPDMGDGVFQVRVSRNGELKVSNIRSSADYPTEPNKLHQHGDSGAYYDSKHGTHRYLRVSAGIGGKYQSEIERYTLFKSPAQDAEIKAFIFFEESIMDWITNSSYVQKQAQQISARSMEMETKIRKIRLDLQDAVGKINQDWWEDQLTKFDNMSPEEQQSMDPKIVADTLIKMYRINFPEKKAQTFSDPDANDVEKRMQMAKDAYEKQKARIAARKKS